MLHQNNAQARSPVLGSGKPITDDDGDSFILAQQLNVTNGETITIPFTTFVGVDFSKITRLEFSPNVAEMPEGANLTLGAILAASSNPVPEPSTAALLLLASVALLPRRRRFRNN